MRRVRTHNPPILTQQVLSLKPAPPLPTGAPAAAPRLCTTGARALTHVGRGETGARYPTSFLHRLPYLHSGREGGQVLGAAGQLLPRVAQASRATPPLGAGGRGGRMGRVGASAEEARGGQRTRAVRECGPVCLQAWARWRRKAWSAAGRSDLLSELRQLACWGEGPAGSGSSGWAASAGGHLHRGQHAPMVQSFHRRLHGRGARLSLLLQCKRWRVR